MTGLINKAPGGPPPEFPLRIASIDIGSNAIRFLAVEFTSRDRADELEYIRVPVRLGQDAFRDRHIRPDAMEGAVEAVARFRKEMDALQVNGYRAVATSAVRDSYNGSDLVERAWTESGIRIETITGNEEAYLVWRAVRDRVELAGREWVLVDLGGGSVEVSLIDVEEVKWSESHPLGTVRLLEEMGDLTGERPELVRRRL